MKTILDVIADTAIDTLELYQLRIRENRFGEANECLGFVARLDSMARQIEDHDFPLTFEDEQNYFDQAIKMGEEIRKEPNSDW